MRLRSSLLLVLLSLTFIVSADTDVLINGMLYNDTLTRGGNTFYDAFISDWEVPEFEGNIAVHERIDLLAGNLLWVDVNDDLVYQTRSGFRTTDLEDKAKEARGLVEAYILDMETALQELEGIK